MSQYGNKYCGTWQGKLIHQHEGTPLCTACRVLVEQQDMMDYFNRMENAEDDVNKPRLVSYHFRVKRRGPLDEGVVIPQPLREDQQVVDFWDRPRHHNVTRRTPRDDQGQPIPQSVNITRAPWREQGLSRAVQENIMRDVYLDSNGLCHDRNSSQYIPMPGQGSNPLFVRGMDTEQSQMQSRNREMCNQCPIKGKCTEMALKTTELGSMFGGLGHEQRVKLRGIISEGLRNLANKFQDTTRVFNIARFINGRPVEELPTEPTYIGEVPKD